MLPDPHGRCGVSWTEKMITDLQHMRSTHTAMLRVCSVRHVPPVAFGALSAGMLKLRDRQGLAVIKEITKVYVI